MMSQNDKQAGVQVTSQLVDYIVGLTYEVIPPEVVMKTKQHILDTLGAVVSGSQLELGRIMVEFVRQQGGKPEATVVASNFKTSCINAAMANGTMGHGDETDDSHYSSITHPGCVVIPAALAAGERSAVNGKRFIEAVGLGYDLVCRMSKTLGPERVRSGHRNPLNICGCYGAAVAAGKVLGLGKEQMTSALSLAGSQASGLLTWRTEKEHMLKSFEMGIAARNGVTAALLAQQGYRTPIDVFENRHSLLQAFGAG
jgi:2-methylcitrate dehydratase PrpD